MVASGAAVVVGTAGLWVAGATAVPGGEVRPHIHYVVTGDGDRVPVGPDACAQGASRQFDNFHNNGHLGSPGQHGVIVFGGFC